MALLALSAFLAGSAAGPTPGSAAQLSALDRTVRFSAAAEGPAVFVFRPGPVLEAFAHTTLSPNALDLQNGTIHALTDLTAGGSTEAELVLYATGGDKLVLDVTGPLAVPTLQERLAVANFDFTANPTESTGEFAGVTGSGTIDHAADLSTLPNSVIDQIEGTFTFPGRRKPKREKGTQVRLNLHAEGTEVLPAIPGPEAPVTANMTVDDSPLDFETFTGTTTLNTSGVPFVFHSGTYELEGPDGTLTLSTLGSALPPVVGLLLGNQPFIVTEGTGAFEGATGSGTIFTNAAVGAPGAQPSSADIVGTITLPRRRRR